MPTLAEIDAATAAAKERYRVRNQNGKAMRVKGSVFIREQGQQLPPYYEARRENKLRAQHAKLAVELAEQQSIVAQSKKMTLKLKFKSQGKSDEEAEKLATDEVNGVVGVRRSPAEMQAEKMVHDEAIRIFEAWDAGEHLIFSLGYSRYLC